MSISDQKRVIAGGLLMIFAYGLSNNIVAYYITPVTQSLGLTRAAFNLCFTLMSVVSFLAAPVYGWMFMKVPVRKMVMAGEWLEPPVSLAMLCAATELLFYAVGILQGAVQSGCTNMAIVVLIHRFFDEKHSGSVTGLVMSGTGICSMLMSGILPSFIERHGWRMGYVLCGCLWAVVMFGAAWLIREYPDAEREKRQKAADESGLSYQKALHCPGFYLLILCVLICNMIMVCSQHFPAYFQDTGMSGVQSGQIMMIFSLGLIVWKIVLGQAYDRLGAIPTVVLCYGSYIIGMWILSLETLMALVAGSLLAAVGIASSTVLFPLITRKMFGLKEYAPIWGNISMATAFGVAAGSPIWGAFYDCFGSYHLAFLGAPVLLAGNLLLLVVLMRKKYYALPEDFASIPNSSSLR